MKKNRLQAWTPKLFFDPPLSKISPNFSVYKISPNSLVCVFLTRGMQQIEVKHLPLSKLSEFQVLITPLKGLIGKASTFSLSFAELRWAISLSDFEIAQRNFEIAQRNRSAKLSKTQRFCSSLHQIIQMASSKMSEKLAKKIDLCRFQNDHLITPKIKIFKKRSKIRGLPRIFGKHGLFFG